MTAQSSDAAEVSTIPLRKNPNFMLLWSGQSVGAVGPQISLVALPLLALDDLHASTFEVSLLTFFGWLPYLLFSLLAGIVVERWDQRVLMIGCDIGRMLLTLSVPLLGLARLLSLWYLYAVVGAVGTLSVAFTVAYRGQLPRLVRSDQLVDGNARLGISENLAELVGPSLSGSLVAVVGAVRTMYAGVVAYMVSAVTLGLIRVPGSRPSARSTQARLSLKSVASDGLTYVLREPILRTLLICTGVSNFFLMSMFSIAIPFLRDDLRTPAP